MRAISSVGQSWRLITAWSRVQVLAGPTSDEFKALSDLRREQMGLRSIIPEQIQIPEVKLKYIIRLEMFFLRT